MFPIFNRQFQIVKDLGTGATSKVYLGESLINPEIKVAIKIYNRKWVKKNSDAYRVINEEIETLASLNHKNIVKVYQAGHTGEMSFPDNGPVSSGVSYMIMEYV